MRDLRPALSTAAVLGLLAVGCGKSPAPAANPPAEPAKAAAAAAPVAEAVAAPSAATPVAEAAQATPTAQTAPAAVPVDRGPWGDPLWSGIHDAPQLLDRVRDRLRKEAPWLASGTWQRKGRVVTRFELSLQSGGVSLVHGLQSYLLTQGDCRVVLPTVADKPGTPVWSACSEFQKTQFALGAWLWLLARGPDAQADVQVETFKVATERGEADVVLFSDALRSRVRLSLRAERGWLRLQLADDPTIVEWDGRAAELRVSTETSFKLEPSASDKRQAVDGRGWIWLVPPEQGEVEALQRVAERSRTVMEGLPRYRLIRGAAGFAFAQIGAPVDAEPDGARVLAAPAERKPLDVIAIRDRSEALAWLNKNAGPADTCFDLMPRGAISGTDQQAVVVAPCDGPEKLAVP